MRTKGNIIFNLIVYLELIPMWGRVSILERERERESIIRYYCTYRSTTATFLLWESSGLSSSFSVGCRLGWFFFLDDTESAPYIRWKHTFFSTLHDRSGAPSVRLGVFSVTRGCVFNISPFLFVVLWFTTVHRSREVHHGSHIQTYIIYFKIFVCRSNTLVHFSKILLKHNYRGSHEVVTTKNVPEFYVTRSSVFSKGSIHALST